MLSSFIALTVFFVGVLGWYLKLGTRLLLLTLAIQLAGVAYLLELL